MLVAVIFLFQVQFANEVRTEHFRIKSDVEKGRLERYGSFLEAALSELQRLYMKLEKFPPVEVWIFGNRKEMQERVGLRATSGGVYIHSARRIVTYYGVFSQTGGTFQTLAHELTHAYQHALFGGRGRLPPWLLEGMAVCCEGIYPTKGGAKFRKPLYARLALVRVETERRQDMALKTLFETSDLKSRHYAYAGTFIYFLLKRPACKKALLACLEAAKKAPVKTGDFLKAIKDKTGWDLKRLQKEFRRFVLRLYIPPTGVAIGKTYKSKMLGFKTRSPGKRWRISIDKLLEGAEAVVYWRKNPWARFSVAAYPNTYGLSAEEAAQERLKKLTDAKKSDAEVAGRKAVCVEFTSQRRVGAVCVKEVWLATERFLYRLKFECKPQDVGLLKKEQEEALTNFSLLK